MQLDDLVSSLKKVVSDVYDEVLCLAKKATVDNKTGVGSSNCMMGPGLF
jgi:hypothetical protein